VPLRPTLLALMTRLGLLLGLVFGLGCTATTTTDTDAGVVIPGCRFPSVCVSLSCDCSGGVQACVTCDPSVVMPDGTYQLCPCTSDGGVACVERSMICSFRGPVCAGAGARCLPRDSSCLMSGGNAPQLVSHDGGSEPRCLNADDMCCPAQGGAADLASHD
jgi:hypothetical protein